MAKSEENKFSDKRNPSPKEPEKSTPKPPPMEQPGNRQTHQPSALASYEPTEMVIKEIMFQKSMTREQAISHLKSTRS